MEKELNITQYQKEKLEEAFEDMRRKVEERVPAIAEVEKRRIELENEAFDKAVEYKNL